MSSPVPRRFTDSEGRAAPFNASATVSWRVSIYVVVVRDDALLLMEPAYSATPDLPGGEVEPGESLVEGAMRECWEETGYHFTPDFDRPVHIGDQWYFEDDDETYRHSLFFAVSGTVGSTPDATWAPRPQETVRAVWRPLREATEGELRPHHRAALAALLFSE